MTSERTDVAVVGFGPTGAVAANLLGKAGLKTLVVDRATDIYDMPRALALDHEIARVLQGLGLAEAIGPYIAPFTASEYFGVDGRLIKRMDMLAPPHPQAWTPSMVFRQPAVEALLRAAAARQPTLAIRLGQTLTDLAEHADGVTLRFSDATGKRSTAEARYVVACDGASSTVRGLVGLELDDLGFDEPWLVVDLQANARGLARLPQTSVQYCEPERPTSFLIGTGSHRRFELRLRDGEDPRAMERPEAIWGLLARWITPADATLWRAASYRFHALVARQWRAGRVLLAGDAAHQQPPFLGQGLCQGVRDVANLAWKLARVVHGRSSETLLDSYGLERAAHVRRLTAIIKDIGALVGERDGARAAARDDRLLAEAGGTVRSVPRQDLMPPLEAGLIAATPHAARGTLFPQPWILTETGRRRLDDLTGTGMRVVLAPSGGRLPSDLAARAAACDAVVVRICSPDAAPTTDAIATFTEADGVVAAWFAGHGATAAIVRPDNYVYAVANDAAGLADGIADLATALR